MSGPSVHVVGANVGTDSAGGAERKASTDAVLQIAFDRMLNPLTVNRQAFALLDYSRTPLAPVVTYDPVARVVSLSNPSVDPAATEWLKPDQPYKIILGIPDGNADTGGVRAIDGATLDPTQPLEIGFLVGKSKSGSVASEIATGPKMHFCSDVLPIFVNRCNVPTCHGGLGTPGKLPAAGLILETSDAVRNTAIGRVAQGSNTGPRAGPGLPPGHRFGVDMPIIDPGSPGNSWLMYKVLLAPPPDSPTVVPPTPGCAAPHAPFPSTQSAYLPLADDERMRLSSYVLGNPMPYPLQPGKNNASQNLSVDELQRLRAWIQQGATVDTCGACQ